MFYDQNDEMITAVMIILLIKEFFFFFFYNLKHEFSLYI
jgi:hypothetical protein